MDTRVLLLRAGCDQVSSDIGAGRLCYGVRVDGTHQLQTAAGAEAVPLRTAARFRLGAWKDGTVRVLGLIM